MHNTEPLLQQSDFPELFRNQLEILQVNLGYLCNLSCIHCHVNAGPKRNEIMTKEVIDQVIDFLHQEKIKTLDLTGGAPEMNPHFRYLVTSARKTGIKVIDRCNLSILEVPEYHDLGQYLADQHVEITASLPCYLKDNVDRQRGDGVFDSSIKALQQLNRLGYGKQGTNLELDLVFNPQGPELPPPQQELENAYRHHLESEFGIIFNRLFTMTNMPIKRFGSTLISKGKFDEYMALLKDNFNPENMESVMCLNSLSVDWQGYVYDCDFNQMLNISLQQDTANKRLHLSDLTAANLTGNSIQVAQHCYACVAGQGSSCGGALDSV